jgi:hypothetical protein
MAVMRRRGIGAGASLAPPPARSRCRRRCHSRRVRASPAVRPPRRRGRSLISCRSCVLLLLAEFSFRRRVTFERSAVCTASHHPRSRAAVIWHSCSPPEPAPCLSADDLECELRRASPRDELRDRVPVDKVRKRLREDARQAQAPKLLRAPGVHQELLIGVVIEIFCRHQDRFGLALGRTRLPAFQLAGITRGTQAWAEGGCLSGRRGGFPRRSFRASASQCPRRAVLDGLQRRPTSSVHVPEILLPRGFRATSRDAPGRSRTCARGLGNRCSIH